MICGHQSCRCCGINVRYNECGITVCAKCYEGDNHNKVCKGCVNEFHKANSSNKKSSDTNYVFVVNWRVSILYVFNFYIFVLTFLKKE